MKECGLDADDEPDYGQEPGQLVLARMLLAQGLPGQALALLDRLYAAAVAQDRIGSVIEAGALRALALAASGEESGAVAALADALTLACPQGFVRIFVDEGKPMAALLGRLITAGGPGGPPQRPRWAPGPAPSAHSIPGPPCRSPGGWPPGWCLAWSRH